MRTPEARRGFTLIELLVAVVIVGILAMIAIPRFSSSRERAFESAMMSDLRNLTNQQEIYYSMHLTYGDDLELLEAQESGGVELNVTEATAQGWAAQATHNSLPGEQCGVFNGNATAANGAPATEASVVGCTFSF